MGFDGIYRKVNVRRGPWARSAPEHRGPMARRFRIAGFCSFLIPCFLINLSCQKPSAHTNQVCFQDHCLSVEVVEKEKELERGLQLRESLSKDAGMLFIFRKTAIYPFWMKDTKIPLDMIWINRDQRIVYIEKNVPPCQNDPCPVYTPSQEALYVLEINGGRSDELNLRIGDRALFKLEALK